MDGLQFVYIIFILCNRITPSLAVPELKLLHVLFTHKLYAPEEDLKENNKTNFSHILAYEYFTSATMDMPNAAKLNMYNLGVHLREIYDEFLGDAYTYEILKMRTTEYPLSMLSAQLVNAGLWPPSKNQTWHEDMKWQPIPTEYMKLKEDTLMLGTLCPNFISQLNKIPQTDEAKNTMSEYQSLFDYLSYHTKRKIVTPSDVALLYASLETMVDRNQILPYWAIDIFPDGAMYNVTLLEYDFLSETVLQRQLNGGTLLEEIIGNSLKYVTGDIPRERKIMMYSGDNRNLVGVLKNLNLWSPHIPNDAASLIFELYYDNDLRQYGIKINYYMGTDNTTISLLLPNCTEICSLRTFLDTTFDLIPEDPQSLCGWSTENSRDTKDNSRPRNSNGSASASNITNILPSLIIIYFAKWCLK